MNTTPQPLRIVVVSAGASDPSSTRLLADRAAAKTVALAAADNASVAVQTIELRELAAEIATALVSQLHGPKLQAAVAALGEADAVIASAPVYKAGASGLFTSFFQVLDNDLLIGRPVLLAATAGTGRHALVVETEMRSLFAYLRALPTPTALFAAPEDWGDPALATRIERAAGELLLLVRGGFAAGVRGDAWRSYSHELDSAGAAGLEIELDGEMMRLATGGSALTTAA